MFSCDPAFGQILLGEWQQILILPARRMDPRTSHSRAFVDFHVSIADGLAANGITLILLWAITAPGFPVETQNPASLRCWSDPFRAHFPQLPRMLMARAATVTSVRSETALSSIISSFARDVSGRVSVGLNAVAVEKARNR